MSFVIKIDLRDRVAYNQVRMKYSPLFYQTNDDTIQLIMDFIGYNDVFDISTDTDDECEIKYCYIPRKEYKRLRNRAQKHQYEEEILLNIGSL